MNEISTLLNFIVNWFNENQLVNTVTLGTDFDIDTQKENIYPIVAINFIESDPTEDSVTGYFDIVCLQQRNVEPVKTDSKLMFDTNFIDNMNETHAVLNKFIQYLNRQNNSENIELVSRTRLRAYKDKLANGLDGFKFNAGISIPNKTSGC